MKRNRIKKSKSIRQDIGRGNPKRLKLGGSSENSQPYIPFGECAQTMSCELN